MDQATEIKKALEAEQELAANLNAHAGEWVAVRNHAVVCHADSLRGLLAKTEEIDSIERILEVTSEPGLSCFF